MYKILSRLKLLMPDLFLMWLLASCISLALNSSLLIDISFFKIFFNTVFFTFIFILAFWNILVFLSSFSTVCFGLVIFIAFFDDNKITSKATYYIYEIVTRVYSYMLGEGNIFGIENIISTFISFFVALLCYFIIVKFRAYTFAILAGGTLFGIQSCLGFITSYEPFYIFVVTGVLIYIYSINYKIKINKQTSYKMTFLISIAPIALVIFFTTFTMRFSKDPIQWEWMDNKFASTYNKIGNLYDDFIGRNDYFSLSKTGFGDNDVLGGSLSEDNTEVLQVWTSNPTYLKARGKDIYTGYSWKESSNEQKDMLDTEGYAADEFYELNFGPKFLNSRNEYKYSDLYKVAKYEVNFLNMRTKSIFIPTGTMALDTKGTKTTSDFNMSTSMDSIKKASYRYEVIAQTPRFESTAFAELLQKSYNGLYKDMMQGTRSIGWLWNDREEVVTSNSLYSFNKRMLLEDYAKRAELIRSRYTVLPEEVPQRVKDLAFKITEGKKSDYDKAKAIEKYLSQNFTYTLEPGKTPKGQDFVDYFLFEQKQGYCVHYATSMAILSRVIGLPARYVEGYRMPGDKDSNDSYIVTNQNAHAWAEIYFEGAGWVQFEATSPFYADFYAKNEERTNNDNIIVDEEEESTPITEDLEEETNDTVSTEVEVNNTLRNFVIVFVSIVASVLIILIVSAINFERHRKKIRNYKKLLPNMGMVKLYEEILHIMKKLGKGNRDNETAMQYGRRIDGIYNISPISLEQISKDFTEARYGGRQIDISKLEKFDTVYTRLLEIYKKEKGKFRFIIEHYFLGTI